MTTKLPTAFRVLPDGSPVPLRRQQWRKIALCLWQHQEIGLFGRTILERTDIDKWSARLSEMKRWLGYSYLTFDPPQARPGDQRQLFAHDPAIELIWGTGDAN